MLRGQAQAPAPEGFAAKVALAVAAEARQPAANQDSAHASRGRLARWGGGALAASVALVALFMARQQAPQDDAASTAPAVAAVPSAPVEGTGVPATADTGTLADSAGAAETTLASAATAAVAVASVPRRADAASRRSATRTQQAARSAAARVTREPVRAVASARPPVSVPSAVTASANPPATVLARNADPFSQAPVITPQARPWPRSTLSQYPASGAFNAGFSSDSGTRTFYPFEPSPSPASPPVEPAHAPQR